MKKFFALFLALCMVFALCACGQPAAPAATEAPAPVEEPAPAEEPAPVEEPVPVEEPAPAAMTYADYAVAPLETEVTVEAYVQATQSWWNDQITVYAQDEDGAYFFYNMACSEEDAAKLVPGTKIRATGFKSEWAGEVEIIDATFEIIEGSFVAEPLDVTALLGTDALIENQNKLVEFNCLTVEAKDENGAAFFYGWDNSGAEGTDADLYFDASVGGQTYTFVIEYYLCNEESEAYQAVKNLQVGDKIDIEGFLYWYEGSQPHVISVKPAEAVTKSEGVLSYADYAAAELETEVTVEAYVQATQSWWNDQITVYAQDGDGAYFFYNMACSEEDAAKLVPGTKIKATGYKSEWAGEVEIIDATFEIEAGYYVAPAADVTALLGTDELLAAQNQKVAFKGLTVEAKDDTGAAFFYGWDGSGAEGTDADLYFDASVDGQTYTFVIEYYLCNESTEAYQAVQSLKVGDVIDIEGFLYWYEGSQPHVTSVVVK